MAKAAYRKIATLATVQNRLQKLVQNSVQMHLQIAVQKSVQIVMQKKNGTDANGFADAEHYADIRAVPRAEVCTDAGEDDGKKGFGIYKLYHFDTVIVH